MDNVFHDGKYYTRRSAGCQYLMKDFATKEKPLQEISCRGFSVKVNSNFVKLKLELHAECMCHKEYIFCATVISQSITIVLEEVTG